LVGRAALVVERGAQLAFHVAGELLGLLLKTLGELAGDRGHVGDVLGLVAHGHVPLLLHAKGVETLPVLGRILEIGRVLSVRHTAEVQIVEFIDEVGVLHVGGLPSLRHHGHEGLLRRVRDGHQVQQVFPLADLVLFNEGWHVS
jgi:hypothetical protein